MIRRTLLSLAAATTLLLSASAAWALTLDDVKEMASVGVPDNIIVSTIQNSEETFNLSADEIVALKKAGVSDAVLEALQATSGSTTRSAETRAVDEPRRRSSGDDEPAVRERTEEPRRSSSDDDRSARDRDEERRRSSSEDDSRSTDRRSSSDDSRSRYDEEEDDGLIRRRRRGDEDDEDDERSSRSSGGSKTPKEVKRAIALIKDKKPLNGSLLMFRALESNKYPEAEAKMDYWLGTALKDLGMLHASQVYFQKVVKAGPSSGSLFTNALAKMVQISDTTKDPIYLIRTIDQISEDDYPGKVKDDLYYFQGVRDFERNEYARARRNFAKLGRSSKHYSQARYHLGVIYNAQDRKKQAFKTFLGIVNGDFRGDADTIAAVKQLSVINLARIRYGVEQFGKAAEFYEKMPRDADYWPTSLYESAWAYFMAENKENKALGNLLTLSSPFFTRNWLPEAKILEALTYYRICEYKEVEGLLDSFKAEYGPAQEAIDELLAPYESGERPLRDLYSRLYSKSSKDYRKLPVAVYARAEGNRAFAGPHNRVLQIEKELQQIKSQKAQWRDSEVGKAMTDLLKKQRKVYMRFAGAALANELGSVRDELATLMGQEALIRFEVVSGEYQKYADRFRNPEAAEVDEGIEFDFATNPDRVYWPFNNEFWHDELGYYERIEPGDCKE